MARSREKKQIDASWVRERISPGMMITMGVKDGETNKLFTGRYVGTDDSFLFLKNEEGTINLPYELLSKLDIHQETCPHKFTNQSGAVEPFGYPKYEFKTMKMTHYEVAEENGKTVGYCRICLKKTEANVPIEESSGYIEAMKKYNGE